MRLDLSVFIGCVMKKVLKIFVFVVLIVAAIAAYIMPRYSDVGADHDVIPSCPVVWPVYEEGYGINYDDFYGEWYTIVSTDSNGYTIGKVYPRDARYKAGYASVTPHYTCYIRMDSGGQILFPREIEDVPISRPATVPKPIKPEATAIPTLVPESTKVPVIPTLVPESTKVPVIPTLVLESTKVPVIPTKVPDPTVIPTKVPDATVIPTKVPDPTVIPTKVPDPTVIPTKVPDPTRVPYVPSVPRPTKQPVVPTATPPGWHCHDYVGGSKREYLPHCHE